MLAFLRALFGHRPPSLKRMMACEDACSGLEARIDQHYAELKSLRGLVNATLRKEKAREDAPEPTNEQEEEVEVPRALRPMRALRRW